MIEFLKNLPDKYKLSSNEKVEALLDDSVNNKIFFGQRQFGKSHLLILDLLYYAKENPNSKIGFLCPGSNTKKIMFARVLDALQDIGIQRRNSSINPCQIILDNGSLIYFFNNGSNIRGHKFDTLYIDDLEHIQRETFQVSMFALMRTQRVIATQTDFMNTELAECILRGNR